MTLWRLPPPAPAQRPQPKPQWHLQTWVLRLSEHERSAERNLPEIKRQEIKGLAGSRTRRKTGEEQRHGARQRNREGDGARDPPVEPSLSLSSAGSQSPGQIPQISVSKEIVLIFVSPNHNQSLLPFSLFPPPSPNPYTHPGPAV